MPVPRRIWTFASGSNNPGEIVGYARAGIPPGVAMLRWSGDTWAWLCGMGTGATRAPYDCWATLLDVALQIPSLPVFVDTGAFAEIATPKSIPPALWHEVLDGELELARRIGPRAVLVLPDKVGDQTATLRRLRQYRAQVTAILDARARGIVVLQQGRLTGAGMAREVAEILGRTDFVLGFPTARGRTKPGEVRRTLEDLPWAAAGVHLLGVGPASERFAAYVAALAPLPAAAWASADAVVHRRLVGRAHTSARGDAYPTRPMTEKQDIARVELLEEAWGGVEDPLVREALDPTEQLVAPSGWMTTEVAREIGRRGVAERMMTRAEAATFAKDPTAGWRAVQQRDDALAEHWLETEIEHAWWTAVGELSGRMRKERAIHAVFGRGDPQPTATPEFAQLEIGPMPTSANPGDDLGLIAFDEDGVHFETGVPVTFPFVRNTVKSPYFGAQYQQDIEPAGRYMIFRSRVVAEPLPSGWMGGTVSFESPLVLLFDTESDGPYYAGTSWKMRLQQHYGKKGKSLTRSILADGYDGIVTAMCFPRACDTREIVDLRIARSGRPDPNPRDEFDLSFVLAPVGSLYAMTGPEHGAPVTNGIADYVSTGGGHRYVMFKNGVPISALQVADLSTTDKSVAPREVGYTVAVYTVPSERRRGHAARLLDRARRDFQRIRHSDYLSKLGRKWVKGVEKRSDAPICVGLVSCSKSKLDVVAKARNLYSPSWVFRKSAEYVQRRCGIWHVLSAKHGLVDPDQLLEPYDVTLVGAPKAARAQWAAHVLAQLRQRYAGKTVTFVLMAGERYAEALAGIEHADWIKATVEEPMRGMSTGARRRWLGSVT